MKNILDYLEKNKRQFPKRLACADAAISYTWDKLQSLSASVGSYLAGRQMTGKPIAIYMKKTPDCLAAMFGTIYAGNFYTVIDTDMPWERIHKILLQLQPAAILTYEDLLEAVNKQAGDDYPVLCYETMRQETIDQKALLTIREQSVDADPAYILFTSGSTGMPKGVAVCHRSIIAYGKWVQKTFDMTEETIFGSQTPFYFSMSVLDIYTALVSGAGIEILDKSLFSFPMRLIEYMNERRVNTIYWVPTAISMISKWKVLDYTTMPYVKKVLFAGEVMPVAQLNYWMKKMPELLYANLYGPTEVTDICAYYVVNRDFSDEETLPIGRACDNCRLLVVKEDGTEAMGEEVGELYVGGTFLAMGYYNDWGKTAKAFVQNPINKAYPEIMYRTGDLVRYNSTHELLYLGRKDYQIKHMGYRIELGEIEAAALSLESIRACACVYDQKKDRIILFYEGGPKDEMVVYQLLEEKLPPYMQPSQCNRLMNMPINANGKIDRSVLNGKIN